MSIKKIIIFKILLSGDILKKKLLEIYNDYMEEASMMWDSFKEKLILAKEQIIKSFKDPKTQKKYIALTSLLIVITILLVNLYTSFAYYNDDEGYPILHAKVGNMYLNNYDYVLLVYLENADSPDNSTYHLANNIPLTGYDYSGYSCQNNSTLLFDEDTRNTQVNLVKKDVCSIFFDLKGTLDIIVNIMLEDNVNSDKYTLGNNIPAYGYTYSHYECDNSSELEYDSNLHTVKFNTNKKDKCNVYFKKENSDIDIKLFVENTLDKNDYLERASIPSGRNYEINNERTTCSKNNGERVDIDMSYVDGYINASTTEKVSCNVYLDIKND